MVHRVACGGVQTERAQERMQQVMQSVSQVSALLGDVGHAAQEQWKGLAQVNSAVADRNVFTWPSAGHGERACCHRSVAKTSAVALRRQTEDL